MNTNTALATEIASELSYLRSETEALRDFVEWLHQALRSMEDRSSDADVMMLLSGLLESALGSIEAKDGSLLVADEETRELVFIITSGEVPKEDLQWHRIPLEAGIAGWAFENRKAVIVNNPSQDHRFYDAVDKQFDFVTYSVLATPVIREGKALGVIEALNKQTGEGFTVEDSALFDLASIVMGKLLHTMVRHQMGRQSE